MYDSELRPDLRKQVDIKTSQHIGIEELSNRHVLILRIAFNRPVNLSRLALDTLIMMSGIK